jgi:6-phosphogluconolactonase
MIKQAVSQKIFSYTSMTTLSVALAEFVSNEIIKILNHKKNVYLSLPGGNSPKIFFEMLAKSKDLEKDWNHIHLFLGDERFVPKNSDISNSKLIYNSLVSNLHKKKPKFYPVDTSKNINYAAEQYESTIYDAFNINKVSENIPIFDIMILGIGYDGHTASIFPNSKALDEKGKIVIPIDPPEYVEPYVPRITMTMPLINKSKLKIFIISDLKKFKLIKSNNNFPFKSVNNPIIFYCKQ